MKRAFGDMTPPPPAPLPAAPRNAAAEAAFSALDQLDDGTLAELDRMVAAAAKRSLAAPPPPGDKAPSAAWVREVLKRYFGYDSFRAGQEEAVQGAIQRRDVCVFWSSGSGKSLCYLVPALVTNRISLVVSPLISLMNDQCNTINRTASTVAGKPLACFLGSGQRDPTVEARALAGEFLVIYITPEKLETYIPELVRLHTSGKPLGLLAVDEAHCISQWGHDFRSAYMHLNKVRQEPLLSDIPIMALTATASLKVRDDIKKRLTLRPDCIQLTNSVDRTNLHITVRPIVPGGVVANMALVVRLLQQDAAAGKTGSTIVYLPTTKGVEAVAQHLSAELATTGVHVAAYHGKMDPGERDQAHREFLTGQSRVIVATVAFGMGIDKPDVRRIVHYGSPKCMEDYYQQIGRAGRDGLTSQCLLLHSDSELMSYGSGFYTDSLSEVAKKRHMESISSMKRFANFSGCRRVEILRHFQEQAPYSHCGTCDNCAAGYQFKDDQARDFSKECVCLFNAIRRNFGKGARAVINEALGDMDAALKKKWSSKAILDQVLTGLLPGLETEEYLSSENRAVEMGGGSRAYTTYSLTAKGVRWTRSECPLMLPVPPVVRLLDEEKKERIRLVHAELAADGVDISRVPADVVDDENGEGADWLKWHRSIKQDRARGMGSRAQSKENLLCRILSWRETAAVALGMAPEAVLRDSLARRIAYAQLSAADGLRAVGLRVPEQQLTELSTVIGTALVEFNLVASGVESAPSGEEVPMIFKEGPMVATVPQSIHIPMKGKPKPPAWQESYQQFNNGTSIEGIAAIHSKGVQVATVLGHLLDAFKFGRAVDMHRLAAQATPRGLGPPSRREWDLLEQAAGAAGVNPEDGSYYPMKGLLQHVEEVAQLLGGGRDVAVEVSEADRLVTSKWYSMVKWWNLMRLTKSEAKFEGK